MAKVIKPTVELEEDVYSFTPADNGAGPTWCHGSTTLVRSGAQLFATGLETIPGAKPLNNCRWTLWRREDQGAGWERLYTDPTERTREPSPLACFDDGRAYVSVNPTRAPLDDYAGPSEPLVLEFSMRTPQAGFTTLKPAWAGDTRFTEHSYRTFVADGRRGELLLLQNEYYDLAHWCFRDRTGAWSATGQLVWPWGKDYAEPRAMRLCYPNVAMVNRAVYFFGVSDIEEPNPAFRDFKFQLTGRKWDYDFRRLFYSWTPDVTTQPFHAWLELASRERTCGWLSTCDLYAQDDGLVHLLWHDKSCDVRLREKFFPG